MNYDIPKFAEFSKEAGLSDNIIHTIGEIMPISDIGTSKGLYELLRLVLSDEKVKEALKDVCEMYKEEITLYHDDILYEVERDIRKMME